MAELQDLIYWFQQKNHITPELGLTDITKLQLLLNHAQAIHCAVYGEPLFSEPFPNPELLSSREALSGRETLSKGEALSSEGAAPDGEGAHSNIPREGPWGAFEDALGRDSVLILKIVIFVYGPKTVTQLQQTTPPEEAWRRLVLALKITNLEIKTNTVKECFAAFKDVYEAYHDMDFENHVITLINGNTFTYNSRFMKLTNADRETLRLIGTSIRDHSYYLHQNLDGSLEITEI